MHFFPLFAKNAAVHLPAAPRANAVGLRKKLGNVWPAVTAAAETWQRKTSR